MNIRIIRKSENITTRWSGGTTSQVYIYPENASYAERNFLFRMSMANAEIDDSVYTSLPGVERFLASLDGECDVVHEGKRVHLEPFGAVDRFWGDTRTEAHGAIRDFNLMLKGAKGDMMVLREKEIDLDPNYDFYAIYSDGSATLFVDGKLWQLSGGDCLLITDFSDGKITVLSDGDSIIICRVTL